MRLSQRNATESEDESSGNSGREEHGIGICGRLGMLELLLWAVLTERDRLAKLLWQHTEEPIRYALLVSQLYSHLAKKEKTQLAHRQKLELSERYEEWAVAMLTSCREEVALELLEDDFEGRWPNRLLELAISGSSKRFVAHEYCEELLDRRWRGDTLDSTAVMPPSATLHHVRATQALATASPFLRLP